MSTEGQTYYRYNKVAFSLNYNCFMKAQTIPSSLTFRGQKYTGLFSY